MTRTPSLALLLNLVLTVACKAPVTDDSDADTDTDSDADTDTSVAPVCNKSVNRSAVNKPRGVFTSVLTSGAVGNPQMQGGLIRVPWAEIEPQPGVYDFAAIEDRLALLPAGRQWSLGIHGGYVSVDENDPDLYTSHTYPNGTPRPELSLEMAPSWLVTDYGVETFSMEFRGVPVEMAKYWDPALQDRLSVMLEAVATEYGSDPNLALVYVPQMTSNGLEGHFNGVPNQTLLTAAGIDPNAPDANASFGAIWVQASLQASLSVATAFDTKPVAFEVHELLGEATIPVQIMDGLLADPAFADRAGIGMWWISGDAVSYQTDLVDAIRLPPSTPE